MKNVVMALIYFYCRKSLKLLQPQFSLTTWRRRGLSSRFLINWRHLGMVPQSQEVTQSSPHCGGGGNDMVHAILVILGISWV